MQILLSLASVEQEAVIWITERLQNLGYQNMTQKGMGYFKSDAKPTKANFGYICSRKLRF